MSQKIIELDKLVATQKNKKLPRSFFINLSAIISIFTIIFVILMFENINTNRVYDELSDRLENYNQVNSILERNVSEIERDIINLEEALNEKTDLVSSIKDNAIAWNTAYL